MIAFGIYYAIAHVFCSIATEQENMKEYQARGDISWWKDAFLFGHVTSVIVFCVVGVIYIGKS